MNVILYDPEGKSSEILLNCSVIPQHRRLEAPAAWYWYYGAPRDEGPCKAAGARCS